MNRELVELDTFTLQLQTLGDMARVDDALTGVVWALSTKPEVYDCLVGDVRLLKTDPLGGLPALSVRFKLVGDAVHLLHVEPTAGAEDL